MQKPKALLANVGDNETLAHATHGNGNPPTSKELTERFGPEKAAELMKMFNEGTMTKFNDKGKLVLDEKLVAYLEGLEVTPEQIANERQKLMKIAKNGDLDAYYDLGYEAQAGSSFYDKSIASMGNRDQVIKKIMANYGLDNNEANLSILNSGNVPKELREFKKAFRDASNDLKQYDKIEAKFFDSMAEVSIVIDVLEKFSMSNVHESFKQSVRK
jgi:hypothetical protein